MINLFSGLYDFGRISGFVLLVQVSVRSSSSSSDDNNSNTCPVLWRVVGEIVYRRRGANASIDHKQNGFMGITTSPGVLRCKYSLKTSIPI